MPFHNDGFFSQRPLLLSICSALYDWKIAWKDAIYMNNDWINQNIYNGLCICRKIHATKEFFSSSKQMCIELNTQKIEWMDDTNSEFVLAKYVPHKNCFQQRDTVLPLCYGYKKSRMPYMQQKTKYRLSCPHYVVSFNIFQYNVNQKNEHCCRTTCRKSIVMQQNVRPRMHERTHIHATWNHCEKSWPWIKLSSSETKNGYRNRLIWCSIDVASSLAPFPLLNGIRNSFQKPLVFYGLSFEFGNWDALRFCVIFFFECMFGEL